MVLMKMNWFWLAVVSLFALSFLFIFFRKLTSIGLKSEVLLMYYFGIVAVIFGFYAFSNRASFQLTQLQIIFLIAAGIAGVVGNLFLVESLRVAPNPGYTSAVVAGNVILVSIAAVFIFQSELSLVKGAGIVLAVIGIILLGL